MYVRSNRNAWNFSTKYALLIRSFDGLFSQYLCLVKRKLKRSNEIRSTLFIVAPRQECDDSFKKLMYKLLETVFGEGVGQIKICKLKVK